VPITIQLGDIANRLRRAFDIRGRIPTALDETIVPTTLVRDAGVLPFALDPAECAGALELTPTAGQQATMAISNQGPKGSVFLLDEIWLSGSAAAGRVEVSKSGVLQTDGVISQTKQLADMSTNCLGLATALNVPVRLTAWTTAPAATGGAIAQIVRVLTTSTCYRVKAMLRVGEVVYIKNLAVTTELHMACAGRFFTAAAFDQ
jgi:hypothetical protein